MKVIRSDNGHEFFKQNGIIHQTSCVETPQQKAIVKRKHESILTIDGNLALCSCF